MHGSAIPVPITLPQTLCVFVLAFSTMLCSQKMGHIPVKEHHTSIKVTKLVVCNTGEWQRESRPRQRCDEVLPPCQAPQCNQARRQCERHAVLAPGRSDRCPFLQLSQLSSILPECSPLNGAKCHLGREKMEFFFGKKIPLSFL